MPDALMIKRRINNTIHGKSEQKFNNSMKNEISSVMPVSKNF
jgi:hypothetical protein